ncbi:MAG: M36 family metallopeptidase [Chitinophagaceae bacterium]|nr:M36 family metallopeptidase [Chitinophagaceae bacterium]
MRKVLLFIVPLLFCVFSINAQSINAEENAAFSLVSASKAKLGLTAEDLSNAMVSRTYQDNATGIRMVYLTQTYQGIPVFNQMLVLAFKGDKLVSQAGSFNHNLEKFAAGKSAMPSVTAQSAVQSALSDRGLHASQMAVVINSKENGRKVEFSNMGVSRENITAQLMWTPVENSNEINLSWHVYIIPKTTSDYWMVRVNAVNNSVIGLDNYTDYCDWGTPDVNGLVKYPGFAFGNMQLNSTQKNTFDFKASEDPSLVTTASYRVVPFPAEAPSFPNGAHAIRTDPWTAAPGNATTLKWHTGAAAADYSHTRSNNVFAYQDRANDNSGSIADAATSTTAFPNLTFDFTPDYTVNPTQTTPVPNQQFNTTNLFYWNNILHDILYIYGFTEQAANFQDDNLGRGGAGNDHVNAEAQDGGGTNNANFSTPADGGSGRMQMYLWTGGTPNRDGDVDNGVVVHEFGHGLSNRLTGGGSGACLGNAEQMGEGWSDYYGLMFTQDWSTATVNTGFNSPRGIGTYALFQPPTGLGIRTQRYCTDFTINNKVYLTSLPAGPHPRGEIWCATLWDMTWNIINQVGTINPNLYNFAGGGGNVIAMKLVTEGMRLQQCSPGFISGRNAILQADQVLYGGLYNCAIWEAFRRRGMGAFASEGSTSSVTDQVPDFTAPITLGATVSATTIPEGSNLTYTNSLSTCSAVTGYTLRDTLPTNVTYVSGGTYDAPNRVVSFAVNQAAGTTNYPFIVNVNAGSYFPPVTLFTEPVATASIPAAWTTAGSVGAPWTVSTTISNSAPNSFYVQNLAVAGDQRLATTASFAIPLNSYPELSFWHRWNTEDGWDGGVVEISTNGGTTWNDVGAANFTLNGYNAGLGAAPTNALSGRSAFTGLQATFINTKVNLASYNGQTVMLRFRFGSDDNTTAPTAPEGWWVDDITLSYKAAVNMRSSLFNAANARVSFKDNITEITQVVACAPTINQQPVDVTTCAGSSVTYTCVGTATGGVTYQWQLSTTGIGGTYSNLANGAPYSGVTTSTLTVNPTAVGLNGNYYRCVVTGTCAPNATSNPAGLFVAAGSTPGTIAPANINVCGTTNTGTFTVAGFNGNVVRWETATNLAGPWTPVANTTNTLTFNNVTLTTYYRAITRFGTCADAVSSVGTVTFAAASPMVIVADPGTTLCEGDPTLLTVMDQSGPPPAPVPEIIYYKFDGTGTSVPNLASAPPPGSAFGTIVGNQTQGNIGQCGTALIGNGGAANANYVNTGWNTNFTAPFTLSFWLGANQVDNNPSYLFGNSNATSVFRAFYGGAALTNNMLLRGGSGDILITGVNPAATLVTVVYNGTNTAVYKNGVFFQTYAVTFNTSAAAPLFVGGYNSASLSMTGRLDEFRLYNRALTAGEVAQLTNCSSGSNTPITTGTFLWTPAAGLSSTTSNPVAASPMNTTTYTVSHNNGAGCVRQANITITVNKRPVVSTQPTNQVSCAGTTANFTVGATGTGLTYQWQVSTAGCAGPWTNLANGAPYSNVTTATLTINPVTNAMSGYAYRVIVNGTCAPWNPPTNVSNCATLTVNPNPTVSITPAGPVCGGVAGINGTQLSVGVSAPPVPGAVTVSSGTINLAVPDNTANGVSNVIAMAGVPANATITNVSVTLNNFSHTYPGDMIIHLQAPNGQILNLYKYGTGLFTGAVSGVPTWGWYGAKVSQTGTAAWSTVAVAPFIYNNSTAWKADAINTPVAGPTVQNPTGFVSNAPNFAALYTTPASTTGNWTLAMADGGAGDVGTLASWSLTIEYTTPGSGGGPVLSYAWSPLTGLYTNATATTPYTGTNLPTVYAAPTVQTTYTVRGTDVATGCFTDASVLVNYTPPAPTVTPNPVAMCLGDAAVKLKATSSIVASPAVWSPATGLFSNAAATVPYVAGTAVDSVWARPTPSGVYPYTVTVNNLITSGATIPLPPQAGTFTGNVRGYWFTAPSSFTMSSVEVPTSASTGAQNIAVVRFNGATPPPAFPATTNAFTTLFLTQNNPAPGPIPVNIQINAGDVIGIMGVRSNINSYSGVAPNTTVINGTTVNLIRMGMQFPLATTAPQQLWQEPAGAISRVFFSTAMTVIGTCQSPARTVTVTVNDPIVLNAQLPANQTICTDKVATFSVAVTAGTTPTYQWQVSTNGGVSWTNVANGGVYSGATTATLTVTAPPVSMNGYQYRAIVTGAAPCAAQTSRVATLTVNPLPVIVISAAPYTSLLPGLQTTLSSTVTPNPAGANGYSWLRNGVVLSSPALGVVSGIGTGSLRLDVDGQGDYQLRVTDVNGCTNISNTITIKDSASGKCFIYPNPTSGKFQVRYYSVANNVLPRFLTIYDSKGDRVFVQNYTIGRPYDRMDVDMRAFGKGLYWVEIGDLNGNRLTMCRVVIQ